MFHYSKIPDGPEEEELKLCLKRFLNEKDDIMKGHGILYTLEQLEYISEKEIMSAYCKEDIDELSNFMIKIIDYENEERMDLILLIVIQMKLTKVLEKIQSEKNMANKNVIKLIEEAVEEFIGRVQQ